MGAEDKFTILIKDVDILTPYELIKGGCVGIKGDKIAFVGVNSPPCDGEKVLKGPGKLLMPGLINAHTHAAMSIFRGVADDLPLMEWLQNHIFPLEAEFVSPEAVYWGTLLSCIEMIKNGVTTFFDGYFFEDSAAEAAARSGLRAFMGQGILDLPSPDYKDPAKAVPAARDFIKKWKDHPLVKPAVFCHSLYTCSPQKIREAYEAAISQGVPFNIHVSESKAEVEETRRKYGKTPVALLEELGLLGEKTLLVHCIHLHEEDKEVLARSGSTVVHCPESNMKLGSGVAPIPDIMKKGTRVALGTDGPASNNDLDVFGELKAAALLHKGVRLDPSIMPAKEVLFMALEAGAGAAGLKDQIGTVKVGGKADLILLDFDKPHLTPVYNYVSHLVYAASGADVDTTIVDGVVLMENRQLKSVDEEEVKAKVREIAGKIRKFSAK